MTIVIEDFLLMSPLIGRVYFEGAKVKRKTDKKQFLPIREKTKRHRQKLVAPDSVVRGIIL
jgi:hypothetical protein